MFNYEKSLKFEDNDVMYKHIITTTNPSIVIILKKAIEEHIERNKRIIENNPEYIRNKELEIEVQELEDYLHILNPQQMAHELVPGEDEDEWEQEL